MIPTDKPLIYQMAHGRMSGERTRQLDYAKIGKTEVALKYGSRSARALKVVGILASLSYCCGFCADWSAQKKQGVETKKRDGNTL